jgi:tetratricopeptide (TPR) repeat protein
MNLLINLIIITLTLSLTLSCGRTKPSVSKSSALNREKVCLELSKEWTHDFEVKDFDKFLRVSKNYLESCLGVHGSEEISTAYVFIAMAFLKMNRPSDALDSANSCISTYYPNPECHLFKAEALLGLYRFEEAKNSLNIAERTAKNELSVIDSYIIASRNPSERELNLRKKSNYMRTLDAIERYKKIYFPQ